MIQQSKIKLGPDFTPPIIKKLILWTTVITLISAFTTGFFQYLFKLPGPQELLSLSWWGFDNWFLWQPLTYLFVQEGEGITFSSLFYLAFNMYFLWIMGTELAERVGSRSFLRFYFICGIASGLIALLFMPIFNQYRVLAGPTSAILAVMTVWAFLNPERELLFFFLIPVKALWLILFALLAIFLVSLSNFDMISLIWFLSAPLIGYFYALIAWGIHSPFASLYKFELAVVRQFQRFKSKKPTQPHKIFSIKTGESEKDDEAFIDAMLEKISKKGEGSLTSSERKQMDQISKKKQSH